MKSFLRLFAYLVAVSAVLFVTGCAKKPLRPNPSQTIMGPTGTDLLDPTAGGIDGLVPGRDPGGLDANTADFTVLAPVYFDFDSAAIRVAERAKVEAAANYLRSNPNAKLVLEGHCDWRGTTEYNMGLGDRRARAVRDFLATFGVTTTGIETVSKGDLDAQEGANDSQMQNDRRVGIGVGQN